MRKAIRLFVLALLVVGGCSSDDAPEKAPAVAASNVIFQYVVLPGDESVIQLTDMHFATPGLYNRHEIQGNIRNLTNHNINAVASGYFDIDGTRLPFEVGYPLFPNRTARVNIPNQSPQVQRTVIVSEFREKRKTIDIWKPVCLRPHYTSARETSRLKSFPVAL